MKRRTGGIIKRIVDHCLREEINRLNDLETAIRVLVESPSYVHGEDRGFNGMEGRKRIFRELLDEFAFRHIVETGTYLGDTSGYMALTSGVPVFTCELNPGLYALAKMRLKDVSSVHTHNMDSRTFLSQLKKNPDLTKESCFFYLDAHWGKDVPLKEEISIVASGWDKFVLMIDDFQVPGDSGYAHGDYGTLESIDMPHLKRHHGLRAYFPNIPSSQERPRATGCVVLARKDPFGECVEKVGSLRRYDV